MTRETLQLHASAVSLGFRAVLIVGGSGSGKTTLALQLIGLGGTLVADDATCLARRGDDLLAWAPSPLVGRIEARGVGILHAETGPPSAVTLVVDLDLDEPERLPPHRTRTILGWCGPLIHGRERPHLVWPVLQFLKHGRAE